MKSPDHCRSSTSILAIVACLLWATAFVGVKYGLQFARPLGFAGIRFMISGLLILPFSLHSIKSHFHQKSFIRLAFVIGLFQTFFLYGFFYLGMTLIPSALGAMIIGSSPLIIAFTAHMILRDDKLTWEKTLCLILGMSGVAILSLNRKPWTSAGMREMLGICLLICGLICSAVGNILVSRDRNDFHPFLLNAVQIFFGGFCLTLISFPVEGLPHWPSSPDFIMALGWLSFISAAAFSIWFLLLKRAGIKVSELNIWKFIIPVLGAILSWLLLPGENPEIFSVLGMVCISASVLFFHLTVRNKISRIP
ncbi:DMT family transporter [bacterium]|nr:DMT family transporter [bacterium]